MKVCVVGSGGREHALAHVLARSADVVVTPGNPGIPGSVDTQPEELEADLFVIGPEAPLVDGLADRLRSAGSLVFGPGADGARLEGSKAWMKELLVRAGVATARFGRFDRSEPALEFLDTMTPPFVVKTDGLAAGKGVVVTESLTEARNAVGDYLSGAAFGDAGRTLVIEEGLLGQELSVLAICDGRRAVALEPAQDFKRIGDGETGPNTGGMGAFSPVPAAGALLGTVMEQMVEPTLAELIRRGIDYRGVLYAGLMLTAEGPRMLEYNVRFGDPETQVVLPRMVSDLTELLAGAAAGDLGSSEPVFRDNAMVTVVCASEGYPEHPRTGDLIAGVDDAERLEGVDVFCAGVSADDRGRLRTAGGRVLNVCGTGADVAQARERAYEGVALISWPGMQTRSDIAAAPSGG